MAVLSTQRLTRSGATSTRRLSNPSHLVTLDDAIRAHCAEPHFHVDSRTSLTNRATLDCTIHNVTQYQARHGRNLSQTQLRGYAKPYAICGMRYAVCSMHAARSTPPARIMASTAFPFAFPCAALGYLRLRTRSIDHFRLNIIVLISVNNESNQ